MVVNGFKDVENRSWPTKERGRIWIHASSSNVTKAEYEEFLGRCRRHRIENYPERDEFQIRGIVGSVEIVKCAETSSSPWYVPGNYAYVLNNGRKTRFRSMPGRLKFFEV